MELPESLTGRLYLLSLQTAPRLRAAALAELWLAGLVVSTGARAADDPKSLVAATGAGSHPDPVAAALLAEIAAAGRPRSWTWWVGHGERTTAHAVQEQLAAAGAITVTRSRWLGLIPHTRVRPTEARAAEQVRAAIRATLLGYQPVGVVDRPELMLAALAVAGEVKPLWDRPERRGARTRLDEIYTATGPIPAALRKVIRDRNSAVAGGATAAAVAGTTGC